MWKEIQVCRVCKSEYLTPVFSLGMQVVKDFVASPSDKSLSGPLELVLCKECALLQLKHTFDQDYLYKHYWYKSGTSPTMIQELKDIVSNATKISNLKSGDVVLDIGANDGTLLGQYEKEGIVKVGFEPSNLWKNAQTKDTIIVNNYFNYDDYVENVYLKKAKIITSIAMFYDLDDPNKFTEEVRRVLADDGVWIIQMNYLGLMIRNMGFDNICHEHVAYYSLKSIEYLLEKHKMEIFKAELNNVNAGSFRLYVKHVTDQTRLPSESNIVRLKREEERMGLSRPETFEQFGKDINKVGTELFEMISRLKEDGNVILIYGASTRGLVILEHAGIGEDLIEFATDKNSDKWGKYLSGTGIKIIPIEEYRKMKPDYLLVLPYQYTNEIAMQERDYLINGGKLIIPLPRPRVIGLGYLACMNETDVLKFTSGYDKI